MGGEFSFARPTGPVSRESPSFDDLGRAPLHDACWSSKPDFALVDALDVAAAPAALFRRDSRGHAPLNFAPRATWELCARFLDPQFLVVRAAEPRPGGVES